MTIRIKKTEHFSAKRNSVSTNYDSGYAVFSLCNHLRWLPVDLFARS